MVQPGYYEYLTFNAPLSDGRADELVALIARRRPRTVLDVGCGWAELLIRTVAAVPECTGAGVDTDETLIARARRRAADAGVTDRVHLAVTDGASVIDAADAVLCIGADHVFGTQSAALQALRALVRPGGLLLFGTGFWQRPPTAEQAAAFGADVSDLEGLDELVNTSVRAGYRPLGIQTANEDEWNAFESGFLADWEEAIVADPRTAKAQRWREQADAHRAGWLRGYRNVLGFAYLQLGVPIAG